MQIFEQDGKTLMDKYKSAIEKITLNAATFSGVEVVPTFINFFYGSNGTGKSTIAQSIHEDSGLLWEQGKSSADYTVLVYNQEFVDKNINYGHLKGVFTLGKKNVEIHNQIAEKNAARTELDRKIRETVTMQTSKTEDKNALFPDFSEKCWKNKKVKELRDYLTDALVGFKKDKKKFAEEILRLISTAAQHNESDLKLLYDTAFAADAKTYPLFKTLDLARLQGVENYALLSQPIISRNNSEYSRFLKTLNATGWVKTGHDEYSVAADGRCPYCYRKLESNFEDEFAACFDKTYEDEIAKLAVYQKSYADYMQSFIDTLAKNVEDTLPALDLTSYNEKIATLTKTIELNNQKIAAKVKDPSGTTGLDSVQELLDDLNSIIATFNQKIQANNDVVNAKTQKQAECKRMLWELLAFELQGEVSSYNTSLSKVKGELDVLSKQISTDRQALQRLESEISTLNSQIVNTAKTVEGINNLLYDSGFQGFSIREKKNQSNIYEVVRSDGSIAVNLSEGERNFIAFLYFYHLVKGSHNEGDLGRDKIVVIDDPVSSMDSSVLFIVSTLVREFIEVCYANLHTPEPNQPKEDYIKQLFVLTHNVYFHKDITYNQVSRFKSVSFFMVNKFNNKSEVKLCVKKKESAPTLVENYNPVQNSYAALWSEFKELDGQPIPLLNVIRRILDYYFIQLCGYDGGSLYELLKSNRDKFIAETDDGKEDTSKYRLAQLMMTYISANLRSVNDDMYHVDENADVDLCKRVFRMIFETLGQEQHFKMMIGENGGE